MRSAEQIGRTVEEWQDFQREQRAKCLREALSILARSRGEHWYRWVTEGRPTLSKDEYERERIMRRR